MLIWQVLHQVCNRIHDKLRKRVYLKLNNSQVHVRAKITKADKTNFDANTAALIKLSLYLNFREIAVKLNGRNFGGTSQLYSYCSIIKRLLNNFKETQETRLLCKR